MNRAGRPIPARARNHVRLALLLLAWHGLQSAPNMMAEEPGTAARLGAGGVAFSSPDGLQEPAESPLPAPRVLPATADRVSFSQAEDIAGPATTPAASARPASQTANVAFSAPVSQERRDDPQRSQLAALPVVFSDWDAPSPAENPANAHSVLRPQPGTAYSFTAPSTDDGGLVPRSAARDLAVVPQVAFSSAYEVPFANSWAYFLQDADAGGGSSTEGRTPQTLGEEPEETNDSVQFLRQDTILLSPGQYQFDLTLQYLLDESDLTLARISESGVLQLSELNRRQRLLLMPLEFRIGVTPVTQLFVNVPLGWSNGETVFFSQDEVANVGGVGDVSLGVVQQLARVSEHLPNILGTVAVSAPTGNSDFADSLATPGSTLGQGCWTATWALTFTKAYDPVVLFAGLGYQWRTATTFDTALGRFAVDPGDQAFYRFGVGFAVNPKMTFSAAFRGAYVADNRVDKVRIPGSGREPMQLRLATTIVRDKKSYRNTARTVEPFVDFGLTEGAVDSIFGVGWTY